jgi:hypothetical protein
MTLQGADGVLASVELDTYAAQGLFAFRRADGTAASSTALAANDVIGGIQWMGFGTSLTASASAAIQGNAGEAWTGTANGSYLTFFTTANGGTAIGEKMRLFGSGGLGLGTTTDPGAGILAANVGLKGIPAATGACTGCIGEIIQATVAPGSAISLTTATPINLNSGILLTAGDWEVTCEAQFVFATATAYTQLIASISNTSATTTQIPFSFAQISSASNAPGNLTIIAVKAGPQQALLASNSTYFCVLNQAFSGGALSAWGGIRARRLH